MRKILDYSGNNYHGRLFGPTLQVDGRLGEALEFTRHPSIAEYLVADPVGLTDEMGISFAFLALEKSSLSGSRPLVVMAKEANNVGIGLTFLSGQTGISPTKSASFFSSGYHNIINAKWDGYTVGVWYHLYTQYNKNTGNNELWVNASKVIDSSAWVGATNSSGYNGLVISSPVFTKSAHKCIIDHLKIFNLSASGPLHVSAIEALAREITQAPTTTSTTTTTTTSTTVTTTTTVP